MAPWRGVFDPSLKGDVREICVRSFCACRKVTSIPHALYSSLSLDICPLLVSTVGYLQAMEGNEAVAHIA